MQLVVSALLKNNFTLLKEEVLSVGCFSQWEEHHARHCSEHCPSLCASDVEQESSLQSRSSTCVGTAKLPINMPIVFCLALILQATSLLFFFFLFIFSFWICVCVCLQVPVSSYCCPFQGSSTWVLGRARLFDAGLPRVWIWDAMGCMIVGLQVHM